MNRYATLAIAMLVAAATPLFAQSIPLKVSSPSASPTAATTAQTFTGRIVKLDLKAGTFTIKTFGSKKELQLKAGEDIDLNQLRRGQRVVVTYSGETATKVVATRSTQ
jgi:hypothetical protein